MLLLLQYCKALKHNTIQFEGDYETNDPAGVEFLSKLEKVKLPNL